MNFIADLPNELLGEIIHKLKPKYYARLAKTCRQLNDRIWSHRKHIYLSKDKFDKYVANKQFDIRRFINLESLDIPDISVLLVDSQLVHLSRLTYLEVNYNQNKDQAIIVRQLTRLRHLVIEAQSITNLKDLISDSHSHLTYLTIRCDDMPPNLFELPGTSRFKALAVRLRKSKGVDQALFGRLFHMTNLRELILDGVKVDLEGQISGFSSLIHLQDIELTEATNLCNLSYVDFEEFQAMKALTFLSFTSQCLREDDFKNIGKLTSLIELDIMEYDSEVYMDYLSTLTNLRRLRTWYDDDLDKPLQFKHFPNLECLVTEACDTISQLQNLSRLTDLSITTDRKLSHKQFQSIGLMTQLCKLDLSCETDQGYVDLSPLINVTAVTVYLPYSMGGDIWFQRYLFGTLTNLQGLRLMNVGRSLHVDIYHTLNQFTQLTKLNIYSKKSTFNHANAWNTDALPFKVHYFKEN